jgi:hypothetical protein
MSSIESHPGARRRALRRLRRATIFTLLSVTGVVPASVTAFAQEPAAPPPSPTPDAPPAPAPAAPAPPEAPGTPGAAATPPADNPPGASPSDRQALEAEIAAALGQDTSASAQPPPPPAAPASAPSPLRLLDLSFDLVGAAGGSSASESDMRLLQAGGHDPKNRGFTVQNVELTFAGVVDPYLRGDANIVLLIDETGETVVELEEAYLSSLDLPFNLQLEAGQFFTEFGRLNPTHPHTWDFVDQPVVNSRFFGPDGLRNPGLQVSWLAPLPFFAELTLSAQDAHGETAPSFRGEPGETLAGRTLGDSEVRGLEDLLYMARLETSFDLAEDLTLVGGVSSLFGPNASADDARTSIYGVDLYAKWRPLSNNQGWPFIAWQTEVMYRRYDAGQVLAEDEGGGAVASPTTLDDYGLYTQLTWGFARPWVAGVRYDRAWGEDAAFGSGDAAYDTRTDPLRDSRQRYAAVLSYYPSEFSKLRLQYNYDRAEFISDAAHSAFVQFEILFGAHGAHKF